MDAFVMGFIGALRRDKGTNELIRAFRELTKTHANVWLFLVGDKEVYETVEPELRVWADLSPRVVYRPPTVEVPKFLSAMDLFVFPSYREGFGSVVIEAEAMGVPVLVSNIPGPINAMKPGETGVVVPVRDWQSIQTAISYLMDNPSKLKAMSVAAVEHVRNCFEQQQLMNHYYLDKQALINEFRCERN
jgi:glycosyltransferase involved in cell wall biosynthesis